MRVVPFSRDASVLVYILRRLVQSFLVLLAVSLVVFMAVYAVGDPIELLVSAEASDADRQAMIQRLGLDLPVWLQYWSFLTRAFQGDLGTSFVHGIPAIELIVQRIPATLELVFVAISLTILIGIPLGLIAGLKNDQPTGRGLMAGSITWRQPSAVNSDNGTPKMLTVSPRPDDGSHCSQTANIRISIMPCQKLGSEKPSTEPPIRLRPKGLSLNSPATRPRGMPIRQVRPMATTTSSKVSGKRCTINSIAGMPCTNEVPRSPWKARVRKLQYCSHTGKSSPSRWIMAWRSASLASALTSNSMGSPTA